MLNPSLRANSFLQIRHAPKQHRRPSNGGRDKADCIGAVAGEVSNFLTCHLRDNRVAPPWSAPLPYRSLSFPLWTPLSLQHSFLNEIQDH